MTDSLLSREELLAEELAEALGDRANLELYLSFADKYPEELLRQALREVLAVPDEKIKKSRGALFTYLVRKHARRNGNHRS